MEPAHQRWVPDRERKPLIDEHWAQERSQARTLGLPSPTDPTSHSSTRSRGRVRVSVASELSQPGPGLAIVEFIDPSGEMFPLERAVRRGRVSPGPRCTSPAAAPTGRARKKRGDRSDSKSGQHPKDIRVTRAHRRFAADRTPSA